MTELRLDKRPTHDHRIAYSPLSTLDAVEEVSCVGSNIEYTHSFRLIDLFPQRIGAGNNLILPSLPLKRTGQVPSRVIQRGLLFPKNTSAQPLRKSIAFRTALE